MYNYILTTFYEKVNKKLFFNLTTALVLNKPIMPEFYVRFTVDIFKLNDCFGNLTFPYIPTYLHGLKKQKKQRKSLLLSPNRLLTYADALSLLASEDLLLAAVFL